MYTWKNTCKTLHLPNSMLKTMLQIQSLLMQQWVETMAQVVIRAWCSPEPGTGCCSLSHLCLLSWVAQTSKAKRSLLSLTTEGQLCPLYHSSWPLCFEALVQGLIHLTGEQLNGALNGYLVSKIYRCQGLGPLAVHFCLQISEGDIRDISLQGRIDDTLYSLT